MKKSKNLAVWAAAALISASITVACVYIEGGSFELGFMYGIFCSLAWVMLAKLLIHMLEPLFELRGINKGRMVTSIWLVTYVSTSLLLVLGIAMSALARERDYVYNSVAYVFLVVFLLSGCAYTGLLFFHSSQLLRQMKIMIRSDHVLRETKLGFEKLIYVLNAMRFASACGSFQHSFGGPQWLLSL
jgi:hypothetical protein